MMIICRFCIVLLMLPVACTKYPHPIERVSLDGPVSLRIGKTWVSQKYGTYLLRLTETCRSRQHTHRAVLEIRPDKMVLVGFTLMGTRGYSVEYDGQELHYEKNLLFREGVQPQLLLLSHLLAYSSIDDIEQLAEASGLHSQKSSNHMSLSADQGDVVVELEYPQSKQKEVRVSLPELGCSYRIKELSRS